MQKTFILSDPSFVFVLYCWILKKKILYFWRKGEPFILKFLKSALCSTGNKIKFVGQKLDIIGSKIGFFNNYIPPQVKNEIGRKSVEIYKKVKGKFVKEAIAKSALEVGTAQVGALTNNTISEQITKLGVQDLSFSEFFRLKLERSFKNQGLDFNAFLNKAVDSSLLPFCTSVVLPNIGILGLLSLNVGITSHIFMQDINLHATRDGLQKNLKNKS